MKALLLTFQQKVYENIIDCCKIHSPTPRSTAYFQKDKIIY